MKFFILILLIINLLFIFGCGITTSTQTGYLKQPTTSINPGTSSKYTGQTGWTWTSSINFD